MRPRRAGHRVPLHAEAHSSQLLRQVLAHVHMKFSCSSSTQLYVALDNMGIWPTHSMHGNDVSMG